MPTWTTAAMHFYRGYNTAGPWSTSWLVGAERARGSESAGPCGIQVLSGAWAADELTSYSTTAQERFIGELKHLAPHADVVVVDVGSGRNPFTQRLWRTADAVLVVTTTEPAAVMNAYAATKTLAGAFRCVPGHAAIRTPPGGMQKPPL